MVALNRQVIHQHPGMQLGFLRKREIVCRVLGRATLLLPGGDRQGHVKRSGDHWPKAVPRDVSSAHVGRMDASLPVGLGPPSGVGGRFN
jgi:hypothetical protein